MRLTAGMLQLKADLARADRSRAAAAQVERWASGVAGVLLLSLSLAGLSQPLLAAGEVASGALAWSALAAAGWAFSRSLQT